MRPTFVLGYVLIAILLLPTASVSAQAGTAEEIRGRVTDLQGNPIHGARVASSDTIVTTAADGRFVLGGAAAVVEVSAPGYQPVQGSALARGVTTDIALERAPYQLSGVSVTGRTRAEIAVVPGSASLVEGAILRERAPVSVAEGLRTVSGVHVADEDPFGLNLNIGFRGLPPRRSSRTLLLEDGIPILLGPYGDPSMHYAPPFEALERVEVLKGSGQIVNGPQTVGGIVNFVTRAAPVEGRTGRITLGGGGRGHRNANLSVGGGREGRGALLDYTFREGDGVRDEHRHRLHNAIARADLALGGTHSLMLKATIWDESSHVSETGLTQAEFEANPFSLPFAGGDHFGVRRYAGQLVHQMGGDRVRLRTTAYLTNTNRTSWRQSGESEERLGEEGYAESFNCAPGALSYAECGNQGRPRAYTVAGVEPRLTLNTNAGRWSAALDLGARGYREDARRRQFVGDTPDSREGDAKLTRDNGITTDALAAYAHARIGTGALTFSPGVRIEHLRQEVRNRFPGSEAADAFSLTEILPGMGVTYAAGRGTTLFGGLHRGFAPPRPADVYRPEPGQRIVVVDPETSRNWEVGARFEPRPGLSADATFFRLEFGNQIIEAPPGVGQRYINGGRTLNQGAEVSLRASLGTIVGWRDDLTLSGSFTHLPVARFERDDERVGIVGNRLPYAPRRLASGSAVLAHSSGVTAGLSFEHTGEQYADEANTVAPSADGQAGILAPFTVTSAFAAFSLPGTRAQLRASVRNLFDEVYITQRNEGIHTGMRRLVRMELSWEY